jgi:hypothetical protein
MTDWYFEVNMEKLDKVFDVFETHEMTLKQWDAFHKKIIHTLSIVTPPNL